MFIGWCCIAVTQVKPEELVDLWPAAAKIAVMLMPYTIWHLKNARCISTTVKRTPILLENWCCIAVKQVKPEELVDIWPAAVKIAVRCVHAFHNLASQGELSGSEDEERQLYKSAFEKQDGQLYKGPATAFKLPEMEGVYDKLLVSMSKLLVKLQSQAITGAQKALASGDCDSCSDYLL